MIGGIRCFVIVVRQLKLMRKSKIGKCRRVVSNLNLTLGNNRRKSDK